MSGFIVPMSSLPALSSITDLQPKQNMQNVSTEGVPFADLLQQAYQNMSVAQEPSASSMYELALGGSDDLHTGAIAGIRYSAAVSFASGLTSSAIQAYNELMRMSI